MSLDPTAPDTPDHPDAAASRASIMYLVAAFASIWAAGAVLATAEIGAAAISPDGRLGRLGGLALLVVGGWLLGAARIPWDRRRAAVEQHVIADRLVPLALLPAVMLVLTIPAVWDGTAWQFAAELPGGSAFTGVAGIGLACAAALGLGLAAAGTVNSRPELDSVIEAWERMRGGDRP